MSRGNRMGDEQALWQQLARSYAARATGGDMPLARDVDRAAVFHEALRDPGSALGTNGRATALYLARYLDEGERKRIFPELVALASWAHGGIGSVRELILSLPRAWVVERIEAVAEPLLQEGTYDEYRRLLELYALLDARLTDDLARRAARHLDPDVREAGEEFLGAVKVAVHPRTARLGEP